MFKAGIYPIRDHYYEPLFRTDKLDKSLREDRHLPGINLNEEFQVELLQKFNYQEELLKFPLQKIKSEPEYYYKNDSFESGDSEYLYSMIRHFKPANIIEVGSGFSTLMMLNAIKKNSEDSPNHKTKITCIEPYEMPWLESTAAQIIRKKVEDIDLKFITDRLGENDFLFIDSSHMIRPQGDVLYEILEILPSLNSGVIIHVHDIFTPKDYLDEWIKDEILFWNEQYLLEAFISNNSDFRIIGMLNFLKHHHNDLMCEKFPILGKQPYREPGSFWMQKVK